MVACSGTLTIRYPRNFVVQYCCTEVSEQLQCKYSDLPHRPKPAPPRSTAGVGDRSSTRTQAWHSSPSLPPAGIPSSVRACGRKRAGAPGSAVRSRQKNADTRTRRYRRTGPPVRHRRYREATAVRGLPASRRSRARRGRSPRRWRGCLRAPRAAWCALSYRATLSWPTYLYLYQPRRSSLYCCTLRSVTARDSRRDRLCVYVVAIFCVVLPPVCRVDEKDRRTQTKCNTAPQASVLVGGAVDD